MSDLVDNLENQPEYESFVGTRKTQPAKEPNTLWVKFKVFDIFRSCVETPEGVTHEDIFRCFPEERILRKKGNFPIHHSYLLCDGDELAKEEIAIFLSTELNIPEADHANIIAKMISVGRSITTDSSASIFLAVASVKYKIYKYQEYLEMVRAQIAAMEAQQPKPIPATKAAIDGLERVIFPVDAEEQQCAICMGEFEGGTEVTRMPCLHIYHGDCIVQWLETCHFCPLCRFPMPH